MAVNSDTTGMRPRVGQTMMSLPITFDYSGGRRDKEKSGKLWAIIIGIVGLIIGIVMMFSKKYFFLVSIVRGLVFLNVVAFIIRFVFLKEGVYRRDLIILEESKGVLPTKEFWGIYTISSHHPYICRFRNGKSGVFVRLNYDVILGKYEESEYEHYEAIADAYNIAGSSRIQMCHIDSMDRIGVDERLDASFVSLKNVDNEDLKDILTDIYSYQKEQMSGRVVTYDTYLFLWNGSDINGWNTVLNILSCFMQANYKSYQVLNEDALRGFTKALENIKEFSVVEAMTNAFDADMVAKVIPIKITHADGSEEKLGKTLKERKEEKELAEKKAEIKKQQKKEAKMRGAQAKASNEEIDLDEEIEW